VRFFTVAGDPSYLHREGMLTARERFDGLARMQAHMAALVEGNDTDFWLDLMSRHDIPVSRVNSLDDVFEDPQLQAGHFFTQRTHPTEGPYVEMRAPVRFGVAEGPPARPAPLLGEHDDEVLGELDEPT
jgi:crotonobetainyl-CoA:carnitine CoA-transferase CaiB-like acyl-CoA transferase